MKYTLKYVLRTDRVNQSEKCPLYLRYTYNRKFYNIPTGITLKPEEWSEEDESPRLPRKEASEVIRTMDDILNDISNRITSFKADHLRPPFATEIKSIWKKEAIIRDAQLVRDLFKTYITEREKRSSKSTITVYHTTLKKWVEFENDNGVKQLFQMNLHTLTAFDDFMVQTGLQPNTRGKYIKTMKSFLNYVVKFLEQPVPKSYSEAKVHRENIDFQTLTLDEFELVRHNVFYTKSKLNNKPRVPLTDRELMIGRMFIFLCSTGLSFVDFQRIKVSDIEIQINQINSEIGGFLKIDRKKNNTLEECIIPIMDVTVDLLIEQLTEKKLDRSGYVEDLTLEDKITRVLKPLLNITQNNNRRTPVSYFPYLFQRITNQEFNREIKDVLKKIGLTNHVRIKRRNKIGEVETMVVPKHTVISSHTGRRTYITLCIEWNIRPDLIMLSTGQKKMDTLNKYIKRTQMGLLKEFRTKIQIKENGD